MNYQSILFSFTEAARTSPRSEFFSDMNLDQVFKEILTGKEEYDLYEFYQQNLQSVSEVNYRLEVMRDLETPKTFGNLSEFAVKLKKVREFIAFSRTVHNTYQKQKWHLDAATLYIKTISHLHRSLTAKDIHSNGLRAYSCWLSDYVLSQKFKELCVETEELNNIFNSIRYSIHLDRNRVIVDLDTFEEDYCASLNKTFEHVNNIEYEFPISFFTELEMSPLETKILEIVRSNNVDAFDKLAGFYKNNTDFINLAISSFDRELQFYISYLEYIKKLRQKGFQFSYPIISTNKTINIIAGYDLALASKSTSKPETVIPNDFSLDNSERLYIITGPNQGGKTTFVRTLGQILFLASLGCPVPSLKAELFLFNSFFSHFAKEEDLSNNAGRLKEELVRLKPIMNEVTENSLIIINELFASTTTYDAYIMGKKVLEYFLDKDCVCLYVTHVYELTDISDKAVSLVACVQAEQNSSRTYKINRRQADGCAYADSVVEKYNLTYSKIKERLRK